MENKSKKCITMCDKYETNNSIGRLYVDLLLYPSHWWVKHQIEDLPSLSSCVTSFHHSGYLYTTQLETLSDFTGTGFTLYRNVRASYNNTLMILRGV